jgi:hypothetical protein
MGSHANAAGWASVKWLLWIGLYLVLGIFVPWTMTRAWAHQNGSNLHPRPKQLFQNGELGLVGLMLAISVVWDLLKSAYMPETIALGSLFVAISGIMAASFWIESYCRQTAGARFDRERVWRDSRRLAFLVLSMAAVSEILLDRFARVAQ